MRRLCFARVCVWFLLGVVGCFFTAGVASGHATILRVFPAPDSRLHESPEAIVLEFNERVERKLFSIRVYNDKGLPVTTEPPTMEADRRTIRLDVPQLNNGWYTVTYRVISADGHPIRGSYVFTVGTETEAKIGYSSATKLHEEHDIRKNAAYWAIRFVYFSSLLALAGWVSVRLIAHPLAVFDRNRFRRITFTLLILHLIGFLLLAWNDLSKLSEGYQAKERVEMIFGTFVGISYLISALAILSGFFVLLRRTWSDGVWLLAVIGAKGLNGHAMGYRIPWITFVLDVLHAAAAGAWVGAVLAVTLYWRYRNDDKVAPHFHVLSNWALAAIVALVGTGFCMALLYTNGFTNWIDTLWGKLLIAKTVSVLFVVGVGALLRSKIRKRQTFRSRTWLIADIALYLMIAGITGVLTYMNPTSGMGPVFWHENVKGVHIAAIITPNEPGATNQFNVSVGTGRHDEGFKKVTLRLTYLDDPEMAPIEVPLERVPTNGSPQSLYNYHFSKEGAYLPFDGKWNLEVRFQNMNEVEYVTTKNFFNERKGGEQRP
ncbi:copper resistance protein CopC [Paenibacillus naphthalenovorans]|uniref:Copper resistance protein CopC n=1 Tax=Paenibacillus naphthalenovorans TaxID=162209 RepID=A0A0U2VM19_9BACL|nr:copper resistance protein CopC [Paenibacillus naphthalenovorans]ALS24339.1 copper resistance protein CopC [Paenibacillus naphthalenovorans]